MLVVVCIVLSVFVAGISIGIPLAAALLALVVGFFAIAWVPFALVIVLFGFFAHGRSIMTHRTRNTLIVTCIAIFIGDLFSVELAESPLFEVLNLPEHAYAGYAALLVLLSALLYVRFVYLDGVKSLSDAAVTTNASHHVLNLLVFPSFALLALTLDILIPAAFTAIVMDRHGCEGFELVSRFVAQVNVDYNISGRWDDALTTVIGSQTWQESAVWLANATEAIFEKFPALEKIASRIESFGVAFRELYMCSK